MSQEYTNQLQDYEQMETECANCGRVDFFTSGWYETDDRDLCPPCAQMLDYDETLDD